MSGKPKFAESSQQDIIPAYGIELTAVAVRDSVADGLGQELGVFLQAVVPAVEQILTVKLHKREE